MFVGKFCLMSNDKMHLFLGTDSSILIISISEDFLIHDKITWPAIQHQSDSDFANGFCGSVIYSVIRLSPDLYEICGKFDVNLRCIILIKRGLVWLFSLEESTSLEYANKGMVFDYSDGYLTLAYLSKRYFPRLELKKIHLISNRMISDKENLSHNLSHLFNDNSNINNEKNYWSLYTNSIRWNKLLQTSRLKNSHFTEGYEFKFYKILSLPGKRYIIFREPAIETQLKENPWTSEHKVGTFTRNSVLKEYLRRNLKSIFVLFLTFQLCCISPTNRDFNYLVALSTSYMPEIKDDLLIYGLFSARDPHLNDELPTKLTNNLVSTGPLALCIYKLSTVDKVIESSDLIMRLPTFSPSYFKEQMNVTHMNYTKPKDDSHLLAHNTHRFANGFKRISRDKYPYLTNLTKCPSSSIPNKRLALEASLLINSVYPERLDIFGMIESRSQITEFIIDPRHVAKLYQDKTQPGQIRHISYTIFYVGTNNGGVFKMLLFNEVDDSLSQFIQFPPNSLTQNSTSPNQIPSDFTKPKSILSMATSGNIHLIKQLINLEKYDKITNLLLLHKSYLSGTTQIRSSNEVFNYSTMDIFSLLIFTHDTIIQVELTQCDKMKKCSECLALRDPDCYWNKILQKCDTNSKGLSNILTGFHQDCQESDDIKSEIRENSENSKQAQVLNLSTVPLDISTQTNGFTGFLFPFQNIWKVLFSGLIGVIIGLSISAALLLVRKKCQKLSQSQNSRLSVTNSKTTTTERSFRQIRNFTNNQHSFAINQSKPLHGISSTSHPKFVTNLNIPVMDNRELVFSQLNNTMDRCGIQSTIKPVNTNIDIELLALPEQIITSNLPLWDNQINILHLDNDNIKNSFQHHSTNNDSEKNKAEISNILIHSDDTAGNVYNDAQNFDLISCKLPNCSHLLA
ncbi:unnamed protein product [Schistosoma turkestanicum]|nr:unnamed protein product [Schistosoma turkestanicum]